MRKEVKIGLFGFGCVGKGLYDVLSNSRGFKAEIKRIVVKDRTKKRALPEHLFSFEKNDVLNDPEINLVVELIDNADDAYHIVKTALLNGKNVVTANKKMIAHHFEELVKIQKETGSSLLYEASACGSIPIIRTLEEYYDNELVNSVSGIFNGSSNYILSKIQNENLDYATALKQAQDLGFAETDPKLDVGGYDAKFKLIIVAAHTYGIFAKPDEVLNLGIQNLSMEDVNYALKNNFKIRLINRVFKLDEEKVTLYTIPTFIKKDDPLYNVDNEYNAVTVEAVFSDKQLFIGKGAGGHPTGSAVLSDVSANSYEYKYEYKRTYQEDRYVYSTDVELEIYLRSNNERILDEIEFSSITGHEGNAIKGWVKLDELIRKKNLLEMEGAFIATTGNINKGKKVISKTGREIMKNQL
jgi:homoserine dehydrogenase